MTVPMPVPVTVALGVRRVMLVPVPIPLQAGLGACLRTSQWTSLRAGLLTPGLLAPGLRTAGLKVGLVSAHRPIIARGPAALARRAAAVGAPFRRAPCSLHGIGRYRGATFAIAGARSTGLRGR